MSATPRVRIHYRRLPDNDRIYDQRVVLAHDDVLVTISEPGAISAPVLVGGRPVLEPGSRAVWFTFPERWHDIGRFHLADGTFTGIYANILTPPRIEGNVWHTTDLFLDLWIPSGGTVMLLDDYELAEALTRAHIGKDLARRARDEASRLLDLAEEGSWPPPIVREWTLERILADEGPS